MTTFTTATELTERLGEDPQIDYGTECALILETYKPKRLLTTLAFLNKLIWAIATDCNALVKMRQRGFNPENRQEFKGHHVISKRALAELLERSRQGLLDWQIPIKGFIEYCQRWWHGASKVKKTFRSIRNSLEEVFELCTIDRSKQNWQRGKDGSTYTRDIPILKGIDFERLLILYEEVEMTLRRNCGIVTEEFFDMLPDHKGANVPLIYNKVFEDHLFMFHRKKPDYTYGTMPVSPQEPCSTSDNPDNNIIEEEKMPEIPPLQPVDRRLQIDLWEAQTREEHLATDTSFWTLCVKERLQQRDRLNVRQLNLNL
ncbi:MAG: hypothetical protein F6K47_04395 [Symploca sp. SIO2E6]|nr:hypothetical protein [Symploca sp. SIO2E6]